MIPKLGTGTRGNKLEISSNPITYTPEACLKSFDKNYAEYDGIGGWYSLDGKRLIKYEGSAEIYEVRKGTEILDPECFFKRKDLRQVMLPESLKTICVHAFCDCSKLKTMNKPQGLKSIADNVFLPQNSKPTSW